MERYRGTYDIFFGVERRMRKEGTEETFNKEAKQGWRFTADATRIINEAAKEECMFREAPEVGISVYRSAGRKGELTERTYHYVTATKKTRKNQEHR